ncbi:hypothetical protein CHS0354_019678 [Potamilus streckersoni]|uniref:Sepiapterin reductase n=1 Tax=Potamilus streckersoni TaxID=2493646 RepID=A0AAE0S9C4_9BIVA|nr:hypothetical protein CHS0354_019678 [Potamilus streckersoni]
MFEKRTFCVVTGAGRGLGKCIAQKLAARLAPCSVLLLLARSVQDMETIRASIKSEFTDLTVAVKYFDQGDLSTDHRALFLDCLNMCKLSATDFEQVIIVHNSGTLGDITKYAEEFSDRKVLEEMFNINVNGLILLNSAFLQTFDKKSSQRRVIINISSLCAIQPFSSWSLYCTAKAARDMFFRTLAVEDAETRVLNYAPGPLDTDMQVRCREDSKDSKIRQTFIDMKAEGKLLSCEESVEKLIVLLEKNTFESGAHVDFYDI